MESTSRKHNVLKKITNWYISNETMLINLKLQAQIWECMSIAILYLRDIIIIRCLFLALSKDKAWWFLNLGHYHCYWFNSPLQHSWTSMSYYHYHYFSVALATVARPARFCRMINGTVSKADPFDGYEIQSEFKCSETLSTNHHFHDSEIGILQSHGASADTNGGNVDATNKIEDGNLPS